MVRGNLGRLCDRAGGRLIRPGSGWPIQQTVALAAVALATAVMISACGDEPAASYAAPSAPVQSVAILTDVELSAAAEAGQSVFAANCAACHGADVGGTNLGPPLVHRIYEPNHHPDPSIRLAVLSGVRQHHWAFGDMPAVAGVSADEVEQIICYVRELQYANQVFVDPTLLPEC